MKRPITAEDIRSAFRLEGETVVRASGKPVRWHEMQDEKPSESLPQVRPPVLRPPDHLHSNKELAAWFIAQGRRVVMPRREGSGCEEITLDYEWK